MTQETNTEVKATDSNTPAGKVNAPGPEQRAAPDRPAPDNASAAAPKPKSRPSWLTRILLALVALLLAFSAGLIGNPWFESRVRGALPESLAGLGLDSTERPAVDPRAMADLQQRVTALESQALAQPLPAAAPPAASQTVLDRLSALEAALLVRPAPGAPDGAAAVPGDAGLAPAFEALSSRLGALEERVSTAEASPPVAADLSTVTSRLDAVDAQLAAVQQRLDRMERDSGTDLRELRTQTSQARQLLSLAAARRALDLGQPLADLLPQLEQDFAGQPMRLSALQMRSQAGPTVADLRLQLADLRPALSAAVTPGAAAQGRDEGLWAAWWNKLRSAIQVRRRSSVDAQSPEVLARRADAALLGEDVAGAITAVESMPQAARDVASGWLVEARTLAAARAALRQLEAVSLGARAEPEQRP